MRKVAERGGTGGVIVGSWWRGWGHANRRYRAGIIRERRYRTAVHVLSSPN